MASVFPDLFGLCISPTGSPFQVLWVYQPSITDIVAATDILNDYIAGIRDNKFVGIDLFPPTS